MSATSDTLTGTTDPLREARAHAVKTRRGKLDYATRLIGEVAATVADLTLRPSVDSGEEG